MNGGKQQTPDDSATSPMRRQGPRPLGLHMQSAMVTWLSSTTGWQLWNNGWPIWHPHLRQRADQLHQRIQTLQRTPAPAAAAEAGAGTGLCRQTLADAIDVEARRRLGRFFDGVEGYRHAALRRDLAEPPVLWQEGGSRLLDYGLCDDAVGTADDLAARPAVFVIPSLVNRGYILDLTAETSLMRWLARQGYRPLMLDWGYPGEVERGFTLTDYVAGRLERAFDVARRHAGGQCSAVLGYCMGGMLAAALAWRRPVDVRQLILLATPWSFHAMGEAAARRVAAAYEAIAPFVDLGGALPVDAIQSLFASLDPLLVPRKFVDFAGYPEGSAQADIFVVLEDWLNDGVPLPAQVAHECLRGWYGRNDPATGRWRIAGLPVDPTAIEAETLVVIPARDRIVPPASAEALAALVPRATRLPVRLGHIGLVVGSSAREQVWQPIDDWLGARLGQR